MSRGDFPKTIALEADFEERIRNSPARSSNKIFGRKFWYSDATLIENGAKRAFVGINPGGKCGDDKHDHKMGYLQAPYCRRGFNAWLDEKWPGGNPHQKVTRDLFREMYGWNRYAQILRETACFNVCPFRTTSARDLTSSLWDSSIEWCEDVLVQIAPKLIICNGSGKTRSPWSAITGRFSVEHVFCQEVQANGWIREGILRKPPMTHVRILGLPFLKRFSGYRLFALLNKIAEDRPFL